METTETYGAALAATSWAPSKDETSLAKNSIVAIDNKMIDAMLDEASSSKGIARGSLSKAVSKAGPASVLFSANDIYNDLAGHQYNDMTTGYKAAAIDIGAFATGAVLVDAIETVAAAVVAAALAPEAAVAVASLGLIAYVGYKIDKVVDITKAQVCDEPNEGQ